MTQMTTSAAGAATSAPADTHGGPIVAAIGGAEWESVLRAARMLANVSADGVVAVAVLAPLPVSIATEESWLVLPSDEDARHAALSTELADRLREFGGTAAAWPQRIIRGDPARALTDLVRELRSPLLLMGIGRHRPLDRILGADTALRAIRRAACPILVVHPDLDAPFHDVVVATDFSPASARAAETVVPLLGLEATMHVVHVWEPSGTTDARRAAADEAYARSLPERFRRFVGLLSIPPSVTIKTVIREGKPAERVLDYAEMHHADLIVAGRHGRNVFERLVVGSQTTALVRGAKRSILVAPEPLFADVDRLRLQLAGTSESNDPAEWETQLRGLSQRNQGRPTVVEVNDIRFGAQVIESGYLLLGAAYDPRSKRIELTLGDEAGGARRVTRAMGDIDSVAIAADSTGRDIGVRISHGGGQTALTFLGDRAPMER